MSGCADCPERIGRGRLREPIDGRVRVWLALDVLWIERRDREGGRYVVEGVKAIMQRWVGWLVLVCAVNVWPVHGEDPVTPVVNEVSLLAEPPAEGRARVSLLGLEISGWTEVSMTAGTADGDHRPLGFNYRSNDFLLQQNWLRITGHSDDGLGLHSDWILPGADYQFTRSGGLFEDQDGRTGIDPVQFFLSKRWDEVGQGLEVSFGRFFSPFGVESIAGPENTLVSHSYSFIYNPFTHTGSLATLQLDENWSLRGGVVLGSDMFLDDSNHPTFLAGFHWDDDDGLTSVDFLAISGNGRYDAEHDVHNPRVFDLVVPRRLSTEWSMTLEGLGGYETQTPEVGTAHWFSGVGYLAWTPRDDLAATMRLELFNDEQGNRTGSRGLYTAISAGLAWQWSERLLLRPELRFDNNSESRPFAGDRSLLTATLDLIVSW